MDGNFLGPGGIVPASQAPCASLLEECFEITQEIKASDESKHVATSLKPIHDRLSDIRAELESLVLTHRWTLRETDLFNYSLSLQEIDKMRVDGKFVDSEGERPPGQYVSGPVRLKRNILPTRPGPSVPVKTVLRLYLPATIIKRTGVRGTYANSMFRNHCPSPYRYSLVHRPTSCQPLKSA